MYEYTLLIDTHILHKENPTCVMFMNMCVQRDMMVRAMTSTSISEGKMVINIISQILKYARGEGYDSEQVAFVMKTESSTRGAKRTNSTGGDVRRSKCGCKEKKIFDL